MSHASKGNPAEKGGIKDNDIIIGVDRKTVSTARELSNIIASTPVNKRTAITLIRNGKKRTLYIKIAKQPDEESLARKGKELDAENELGLKVSELTPKIARQLGFDENEMGVVIANVEPGSKGELAGMRQGDLIKEINRRPVSTLSDYHKKMQEIKKGETIHLLLKRIKEGFVVKKITK